MLKKEQVPSSPTDTQNRLNISTPSTLLYKTHLWLHVLRALSHFISLALTQQCAPLSWRWLYSAVQLLCYPYTMLTLCRQALQGSVFWRRAVENTNMLQHMLLTLPLLLSCTSFSSSPQPCPLCRVTAAPPLNFHEPPLFLPVCVCVCVWSLETLHYQTCCCCWDWLTWLVLASWKCWAFSSPSTVNSFHSALLLSPPPSLRTFPLFFSFLPYSPPPPFSCCCVLWLVALTVPLQVNAGNWAKSQACSDPQREDQVTL